MKQYHRLQTQQVVTEVEPKGLTEISEAENLLKKKLKNLLILGIRITQNSIL